MSEPAEKVSPLQILRTNVGVVTHLSPTQPLQSGSDLARLTEAMETCLKEGDVRVVLELGNNRFVNSRLLDALTDLSERLFAEGGWLKLARVNSTITEVMRITGLSERMLVDADTTELYTRSIAAPKQRLGDILLAQGVVTEENIEAALKDQQVSGKKLGEILIERGWVSDQEVLRALSSQLSIPHVRLKPGLFDPEIGDVIERRAVQRLKVLPLFKVREELTVATSQPQNAPLLREVADLSGCRVRAVYAPADDILDITSQSSENVELGMELFTEVGDDFEVMDNALDSEFADIDEVAGGSPIVNLANSLIQRAIRERASDIHIEPFRDKGRIRFRIDGMLYEVMVIRPELLPALVSRLKVMANLDIAERRLPQDGRIQVMTQGRPVDLRFSSLPGLFGEKVVLRVLDKGQTLLDMDSLGMRGEHLKTYQELLGLGYGLILMTGPTGSGKTTSLYAALNHLNGMDKNIVTIEDPVEYQMDIVNQNEVRANIGLTFASILKHVLRQDPDIIMVGEIRERETAEIAVQAALTGHLVLSTLHTNDSVGAITRLIDMGVEPYLLSSALVGVLAQRLVRTVCSECRTEYVAQVEIRERYNWRNPDQLRLARGRGCSQCYDSGYKGRMAIHESLKTTEPLQELIISNPSRDQLSRYLNDNNVTSLFDDGLRRVEEGKTTIEEVSRVVNG